MSGTREAMQKQNDFTDRSRRKVELNIQPLDTTSHEANLASGNATAIVWYIHCIFLGFIYSHAAKIRRKTFHWHFLTFSLGK